MGCGQAKEPTLGKVRIRPALMIAASLCSAETASASFSTRFMLRRVQAGTRGEGRRELAWPRRDNQHESRGQCTRLLRSAISDREYLDRGSRGAGRDCNERPIQ